MSRPLTYHDVPALLGAGALGHTWVSTYTGKDGATHLRGQTSSGHDAVRIADESGDTETARFFERCPRRRDGVTRWREVPRRLASIQ
jgi:hypothetical protein